MKLTKSKLQQIINEELEKITEFGAGGGGINVESPKDLYNTLYDYVKYPETMERLSPQDVKGLFNKAGELASTMPKDVSGTGLENALFAVFATKLNPEQRQAAEDVWDVTQDAFKKVP